MYSPEQTTPTSLEDEGILVKRENLAYATERGDQEGYDLAFHHQGEYDYSDVYLDDLHNGWDKGESMKLAPTMTNFGYDWEKPQAIPQQYEEVVTGEGVIGGVVGYTDSVGTLVKQEPINTDLQPQEEDQQIEEDQEETTSPAQPRSDLVTYELSFTDYEYDLHLKDGNWDKEDTLKLTSLVSTFGFDWDRVSQSFKDPAKNSESCKERYDRLINFLRTKNPHFFQQAMTMQAPTTCVPGTAATASPSPYNVPSLSSSLGSFIASKKRKADVALPSKGKPNDSYICDNDAASKKKRSRRTASEIERNYKCAVPNCLKAYGSEGALKMHVKLKHPLVKTGSQTTASPVVNGGRTWGNNWTASY
eukprot:TRINITY_DN3465_c0_g1_i1.p1 TRINITY_DN3465_c0_g1~~TRINITY_DN3465_c0_g1_i1.p1  ORF type:complete len:362 (-),score=78.32 TRINITY_DN3465_c0_g1_i1:1054-2139(-)